MALDSAGKGREGMEKQRPDKELHGIGPRGKGKDRIEEQGRSKGGRRSGWQWQSMELNVMRRNSTGLD